MINCKIYVNLLLAIKITSYVTGYEDNTVFSEVNVHILDIRKC